MSCDLTQSVLHGYIDGELDAARAADFERHLVSCSECVAALEAQETLRASLQRADGASTVRNGNAQRWPANGTGNITASDSQRNPLVLTKWPCDERTASR